MTRHPALSARRAFVLCLSAAGCAESGLPPGDLPDLGVAPDLRGVCPGQPTFGRPAQYAIGPNATFLHMVTDLDRDGRGDLIATRISLSGNRPDQLTVSYGEPGGGFSEPASLLVSEGGGVTAGDLDGDGWPDLVVGEVARNVVRVLRNNGGRRLPTNTEIPLPDSPSELALADLDGDGDLDMVVSGSGHRELMILLNQAGNQFTLRGTVPLHGVTSMGLSVLDMNGDRRPDVLIANYNEKTVTVFSGRGDGTFAGADFPAGGLTMDLSVGDIDGDRAPDVITADFRTSRYFLLRNHGAGSLEAPAPLPLPDQVPSQRLAIADVTGDGLPELFYIHRAAQGAGVLVNAGGGRFQPPRHLPLGREGYGLHVADHDGDGALDLVTTTVAGALDDPASMVYATVLHNLCSP